MYFLNNQKIETIASAIIASCSQLSTTNIINI